MNLTIIGEPVILCLMNKLRIPWNKGNTTLSHFCKNCGVGICSKDKSKKFCCLECKRLTRDKELQKRLDLGVYIHPQSLRPYLLRKYGHVCSQCKLSHWMGKPIPLNLDHKDGNSENNFESNLRFLCLNCDGISSTYAGKNRGKGRKWRRERYKKVTESAA